MSGAAPSITWFVARGGGMVAYVLLTSAVIAGIAVSKRWHTESWPRLVVERAHRWLTVTFLAFVLVHSLAILLDPFTHFGLADVALPFWSGYRTLWLAFGIIATELAIAIAASLAVRDRIGYRAWHALHTLTYVLFPLSLLHGLGTGTDTQTSWATLLYAASVALVAGALLWRTFGMLDVRRWTLAGSVVGGVALLVWCLRGPYAPRWAEAAGTPPSLLHSAVRQEGGVPVAATPAVPALPSQVNDTVSGQTQVGRGGSQIMLRGTGAGSLPLDVAVQIVQSRRQVGGEVQLRTADHVPLCAGPITAVTGGDTLAVTCSGYGQQVQFQLTLRSLDESGFSGVLRGGP